MAMRLFDIFVILVILVFQVVSVFFPKEGKALYGNRLEGIEKVEITDSKKEQIENSLKEDSITKEANVSVAGKIIEVIVIVQDDTTIDSAKTLSTKVLNSLNENEKIFYDIQVFIKKNTDANNFPIIGYKHHAKENFSWTKDREAA